MQSKQDFRLSTKTHSKKVKRDHSDVDVENANKTNRNMPFSSRKVFRQSDTLHSKPNGRGKKNLSIIFNKLNND